ncbi:MAG: isopentenyl-diphosphate Delta-isomerase [Sphingobacteriales bacterium JAD_PAG50586_3]|nr:MAG: isopentenyl-diphosphate Delta-isomerase [Sphingobacteriales bacterium JAD_PAG50586_3]
MQEYLILVDDKDREIDRMEKMEAHEKGLLHRAFSVVIYNSQGQMLLQQRAAGKYHSPMLWTNACCGHPRPGEETIDAAKRRLKEENGFTCDLKESFVFKYKAAFENGLTEHEIDHVFTGYYDGEIPFNPAEANAVEWLDMKDITARIAENPDNFTVWFKILLQEMVA